MILVPVVEPKESLYGTHSIFVHFQTYEPDSGVFEHRQAARLQAYFILDMLGFRCYQSI